ncbi:hypothetical protein VTN96DRAFT_10176 [Rasamsonia emersonii]
MSTPQARNGIESATAGMTLDEMLTKYPKRQVEQAVTQRKYKEGRERTIRQFEEQIRQGINAETCNEGLENLLKTTPPAPPHGFILLFPKTHVCL